MPFLTNYSPDGSCMVRTAFDVVTGGEALDTLADDLANPDRLRNVQCYYVDLLRVTGLELSSEEFKRVVDASQAMLSHTRLRVLAIVAPDDLAFGVARMWESSTSDGWESRVFRSQSEAASWPPLQPWRDMINTGEERT